MTGIYRKIVVEIKPQHSFHETLLQVHIEMQLQKSRYRCFVGIRPLDYLFHKIPPPVMAQIIKWAYRLFPVSYTNFGRINHTKLFFEGCKTFAKQFYPFLKDQGFAGFDYGECVRMIRECYAVELLDRETADMMLQDIGTRAFRQFDRWEEYALSYLCGGCYFMFRSSGMNNDYGSMMFQNELQAIEKLFFENRTNVWNRYSWLEGKKYFPGMKEGKKLIDSTLGCFVTDRVSIDQDAICYMVREEPSKDNPDSGWRIFAGDETQEYIDDIEHTQVFALNTVCNYDPEIIPFLDEPIGTVIVRNREEKLEKEEKQNQ